MRIVVHAKRVHVILLGIMTLVFLGAITYAASAIMSHPIDQIEVQIGTELMSLQEALDADLITAATVLTANRAAHALTAGDSPLLGGASCDEFTVPTFTCSLCVDANCQSVTQAAPCTDECTDDMNCTP